MEKKKTCKQTINSFDLGFVDMYLSLKAKLKAYMHVYCGVPPFF